MLKLKRHVHHCRPGSWLGRAGAVVLAGLLVWGVTASAQAPLPTPNLDLWDNGAIYVIQPDGAGGYYIGGGFTQVQGAPRTHLAHILPSGNVNPAFAPTLNGSVFTIQVDTTGAVLAGGSFTAINGVPRAHAAKLSATGVLDAAWNPTMNATVERMRLDGAGNVFVAGSFTTVSGLTRNRLARIPVAGDGAPDTGWTPATNGQVTGLAVTSGGKVWATGAFTSVNSQSGNVALIGSGGAVEVGITVDGYRDLEVDATGRLYVCGGTTLRRYSAAGTLDATWQPTPNAHVLDCELDGGSLLVSGRFTTISGQARTGLVRIGTGAGAPLDAVWVPDARGNYSGFPGSDIWAVARVSPSQVAFGGELRLVNNQPRAGLGRVDATSGAVLDALHVERVASAPAVVTLPDGSRVVGGTFWRAGAHARQNLLRVTAQGVVDPAWDLPVNGRIMTGTRVATQQVVLGGYFTAVAGVPRTMLFKLADASQPSPDSQWTPNANGAVTVAVRESTTDRVYVGGVFTQIGGVTRNRAARLADNPAGTVEAWNPNINGQVNAIAQPWGFDIWIGGVFTGAGGVSRNNLAVIDTGPTATLSGINPAPNGGVWSLTSRTDVPSNVYVGGAFSTIGGQARQGLASLNGGSPVAGWNPGVNVAPQALLLDNGGHLYVGGGFTQLGGVARSHLARVDAGGTGALDAAYAPTLNGSVLSIGWDTAGVVIGGSFTQVSGQSRRGVAVIDANAPSDVIFANGFQSPTALLAEQARQVDAAACWAVPAHGAVAAIDLADAMPACMTADVSSW